MNLITSPFQSGTQDSAVVDMQDAFLFPFSHQVIKALPAPNHPNADELETLTQALHREQAQSTFGIATQQLVRYFQNQHALCDDLATSSSNGKT
jgi:hypothetical protein